LKFFPADSKDPVDYQGEREVPAMTDFLNEHAGTSRNVDGSLKEGSGHIAALNDIIKSASGQFSDSFLTSITNAAKDLVGKEAAFGKHYVNAAAKMVSKGADYAAKEISRLEGMLKSASVTAEQKSNFQLRKSILKAFM
jgi:protein disulfide-isomerase A6